ncbi:MAG: PPC domain-containing DNA-binding protein [Methanoregula sp.]|jgi:hypothetical protein
MQYSEGQLGRVFVVRIDDGEDFLATIQHFVLEKEIQAGSILFLGALRNGRMVTGPEKPVIPPEPHYVIFDGGWETFGIATIYPGDKGPSIHYHTSVGRAGHALTGCLREKATTYLLVEAVILEFTGLNIRRTFDEKMQVNLPKIDLGIEPPEQKPAPDIPEKAPEPTDNEKKEDTDDLPGGLADIIRDLTRRPPT